MGVTALLAGAVAFVAGTAFADTVVFDERLDDGNTNDSGYRGLITTNVLVPNPNGGWQVTDGTSQIRYDLNSAGGYSDGLACGTVEVDFRALDPIDNFHGLASCGGTTGAECYVNFVGVYEGTQGDFHKSGTKDESFLLVHAMHEQVAQDAWRNSRLKFMGSSWNWNDVKNCIVNQYLPPMNKDDQTWANLTESVYTATTTWSCAGAQYKLERTDPDGGTASWTGSGAWSWAGDPGDRQPNFRYVFIGKDNANSFFITGTIFQRVRVTAHTPCDCPAPEPDAGPIDAGPIDAGVPKIDATVARIDASVAKVDATVPRIDASPGADASAGDRSPTKSAGGCSCDVADSTSVLCGNAVWVLALAYLRRRGRISNAPMRHL